MGKTPRNHENAEAQASRAVAEMRQARNWSYGDLAKRMLDDAGCTIDRSSLQKIEKATPPRKISLNELVAFSKVFEAPLSAFLGVDFDAENELTWSSIDHAERLASVMLRARDEYQAVIEPLQDLASRDTRFRERMKERFYNNLGDRRIMFEDSVEERRGIIGNSPLLTTAFDVLQQRLDPLGEYPLNFETGEPDLGE